MYICVNEEFAGHLYLYVFQYFVIWNPY